jgi:protoporphyrinogen oxidase
MPEIIIIGAGITGLACAGHCKKPSLILEKNATPGGLCGSVVRDGFTFDYAGHFLHIRTPAVKRLMTKLLKNKLRAVTRCAGVHSNAVFVPYPFQAHLHALPAAIRNECLQGFINRPAIKNQRDFYSWSLATFGRGITRHFMKPYNEKLWTVSSKRLTADWVAPFVPQPSRREIEAGAAGTQHKDFGYNISFLYPDRGGCQTIINAFAAAVPALKASCAVQAIDPGRKQLSTSDGKTWLYETLVSTQPLPELLAQIQHLPTAVKAAARKLAWNSVTCLNLGLSEDALSERARSTHWIYFPEKKYPFYRAGNYSAASSHMAPQRHAALYVELSRHPHEPAADKARIHAALRGLRSTGILAAHASPDLIDIRDIPYAYVIFDRHRVAALQVIMTFLRQNNIYSIGRYGAWEYSFMEKSILDAQATAKALS